MKHWCQTEYRGKNRACETELIIAPETVLFPPLADDPSSHFYTERLRQTHTHWLGT